MMDVWQKWHVAIICFLQQWEEWMRVMNSHPYLSVKHISLKIKVSADQEGIGWARAPSPGNSKRF